jgi:hypothetical protein
MPHVQQWINKTLSPIFIGNLQFSTSTKGSSKFLSFNILGKEANNIALPNMDSIKFIPVKGTISMQFSQDILNYIGFDVSKFDYKPRSYFLLARDILHITDAQMIANTLNFFVEQKNGNDKYDAFIDDINKHMHTHLLYATNNKSVSQIATIMQQQFHDKVADIIYQTYITGKSDEITRNNIQHFYNITGFFRDGLEAKINDMMCSKLQFKQTLAEGIEIPLSILIPSNSGNDKPATFESDYAKAVLNYKERQLELVFTGHLNYKAIVKGGFLMDYNGTKTGKPILRKPQGIYSQPQDFREFDITVSENGILLVAKTPQNAYFQLFNKKW